MQNAVCAALYVHASNSSNNGSLPSVDAQETRASSPMTALLLPLPSLLR